MWGWGQVRTQPIPGGMLKSTSQAQGPGSPLLCVGGRDTQRPPCELQGQMPAHIHLFSPELESGCCPPGHSIC